MPGGKQAGEDNKVTKLEEYIKSRDYTGALALLEFNRKTGEEEEEKVSFSSRSYLCPVSGRDPLAV